MFWRGCLYSHTLMGSLKRTELRIKCKETSFIGFEDISWSWRSIGVFLDAILVKA